jgi:hypothetical protein
LLRVVSDSDYFSVEGCPQRIAFVGQVRFCEGFRMPAHRDGSACTRAVVRKPPVKERAGEEVPTVPRVLWRFDRGVEGGLKTRERGREEIVGGGGSRARLSRDDDVFSGKMPC